MAGKVNDALGARESRDEPPVEQVKPGIWQIPVIWPGSALGYTLAYLASHDGGAALVDTGWPTETGWETLVRGVGLAGYELTDITHVLVTHAHPDHLGIAGRLREASGALIGMHPAESELLRRFHSADPTTGMAAWLRARGAAPEEVREIVEIIAGSDIRTRQALPDVLVEDGARPVAGLPLRAVWTPGHTPGHLCFHDEARDLMLTGDHVLPRISPHIAYDSESGPEDPLRDYLTSLRRLGQYSPAEVLPAHEYRFTGLAARLAALLAHHAARLNEIERAVADAPGSSTWRVAELLTWSRGWEQTQNVQRRAAASETLAHLIHLGRLGRVTNDGTGVDAWRVIPQ